MWMMKILEKALSICKSGLKIDLQLPSDAMVWSRTQVQT